MKLQMKLLTGSLKGKDWDEILPEVEQDLWREILKGYVKLPKITIPRFCLPSKKFSNSKIRLMRLSTPERIEPRHLVVLSPSHKVKNDEGDNTKE